MHVFKRFLKLINISHSGALSFELIDSLCVCYYMVDLCIICKEFLMAGITDGRSKSETNLAPGDSTRELDCF